MRMDSVCRLIVPLFLCFLYATDAGKEVPRHSPKAQSKHSVVTASQSLYNSSFQQPLSPVPQMMGQASAIAVSMSGNSFARLTRRDTCENLQNCASLEGGGKGKCCGPSDASWCCQDQDDCGLGDGNFCRPHRTTCGDLSNCVTLSDGATGRCCLGNDGNGDWCCGMDYLCGDGVDGNYCSWVVTTTTLVLTGTKTIYMTEETTVAEPGDTEWATVTSTSIKVVTVSSADVATKVEFVTRTAAARLARNVASPKSTATVPIALGQQAPPITQIPTSTKRERKSLKDRDVIVSTVTETSTSYLTRTETNESTSTKFVSVTSTSTLTSVSTITSVLNARTTTTVTSTITQPGEATDPPDTGIQTSDPSSTGGSGGGGENDQHGNSDTGLSTATKAGIGAGTGIGSLVICLTIGFICRRRRKPKREEQQTLINDTIAATAAQYGRPHPGSLSPPMTEIESSKYASHGNAIPSSPPERYSDLIPTKGTTSQSPLYAPQVYSHELASSPASQYIYPRPPSPRVGDGQRMYSYGNSAEIYSQMPAEVAATHSPRPQAVQPMTANNMSDLNEWRQ